MTNMTPKQAAQAAVQASFNHPAGEQPDPSVLPPLDQQQVETTSGHPRRRRRSTVAAG